MKLSTLFIVALGEAAIAYQLGGKATGMTDPLVTKKCSLWANKIASGDTCKKLESDFDIDFLQLHEWNPSLVIDPCNPIHGWSYCVGSPSKTNSLASLVGTEAPTLRLSDTPSTSTSMAATSTTSSKVDTTLTDASSTSSAAASATASSDNKPEGNVATGHVNVSAVTFLAAFSAMLYGVL